MFVCTSDNTNKYKHVTYATHTTALPNDAPNRNSASVKINRQFNIIRRAASSTRRTSQNSPRETRKEYTNLIFVPANKLSQLAECLSSFELEIYVRIVCSVRTSLSFFSVLCPCFVNNLLSFVNIHKKARCLLNLLELVSSSSHFPPLKDFGYTIEDRNQQSGNTNSQILYPTQEHEPHVHGCVSVCRKLLWVWICVCLKYSKKAALSHTTTATADPYVVVVFVV